MTGRAVRPAAAVAAGALLLAACTARTAQAPEPTPEAAPPQTASSAGSTLPAPRAPTATGRARPTLPATTLRPDLRFGAPAVMTDVRRLALGIGPRLATGAGYQRAARLVEQRLRALGYDVERQPFRVPAGDSWGVPVEGGRSVNVVARPSGFDPSEPHLLVGAHLDTVAVSPGAEDNASGVAVLLEVARLAAVAPPRLPTVLVAFGGEEPRGPGDDLHHFGSRHYVAGMSSPERTALRAMVSLDRVGVGSVVPVCTGPLSAPAVADQLVRVARRLDIAVRRCANVASDHWSFEKAGFPVARLGSTPYAGYHSAQDLPEVVRQGQVGRVGRLVWGWISPGPAQRGAN